MTTETISRYESLLQELTRLDLMLQRQILRLRARHQLIENEYRGMYIPDELIDGLMKHHPPLNGHASIEALTQQIESLRDNEGYGRSPLRRIAERFELSAVETDLLLIAVAPALELRYETFYAYVQNDVAKKQPTLDLALKLIYDEPGGRLAGQRFADPDAPLFRRRLLELVADPQDVAPPRLAHYLQVAPRVTAEILGDTFLDATLRSFCEIVEQTRPLSALPLPEELCRDLEYTTEFLAARPAIVFLQGAYGTGKRAAAAAMSAILDMKLLGVDLQGTLAAKVSLSDTLRLLKREAILQGAAIYLDHYEALDKTNVDYAGFLRLVSDLETPVFIGSTVEMRLNESWPGAAFFNFQLPMPDFQQRIALWGQSLNGYTLHPNVDLAGVAGKFRFSGGQIQDAARFALHRTAMRPEDERALTAGDLHAAARACSNQALQELAQKIEPKYHWDDIVLPRARLRQLREVYLSVKYRHVVYTEWGFERKLSLGKGISALFYGPSGTGKTMAAEILANELALELYKIDLSTVVSKYIGETEKNLSRIFGAAEASNAILFFDEADALFGKRSEVKDARDRYANIEVAYLLQKMEEYEGITLMATNLRGNIDDAFARRLQHTVEFPFPETDLRERIWRNVFPAETPLNEDIDHEFLACQFELAGGNIRNVALSAAFAAAEADCPVNMELLVLGVARELQKKDELPTKAAFREYYIKVREQS